MMTPEIFVQMKQWEDSGDEDQKRHAKFRLALPDALEYAGKTIDDFPEIVAKSASSKLPSAIQQLKNFKNDMMKIAAEGVKLVSEEERARRLLICAGDSNTPKCEFYRENDGRCGRCGCFLSIKVLVASWHCPINKW